MRVGGKARFKGSKLRESGRETDRGGRRRRLEDRSQLPHQPTRQNDLPRRRVPRGAERPFALGTLGAVRGVVRGGGGRRCARTSTAPRSVLRVVGTPGRGGCGGRGASERLGGQLEGARDLKGRDGEGAAVNVNASAVHAGVQAGGDFFSDASQPIIQSAAAGRLVPAADRPSTFLHRAQADSQFRGTRKIQSCPKGRFPRGDEGLAVAVLGRDSGETRRPPLWSKSQLLSRYSALPEPKHTGSETTRCGDVGWSMETGLIPVSDDSNPELRRPVGEKGGGSTPQRKIAVGVNRRTQGALPTV